MQMPDLTEREFQRFQQFILQAAGIQLGSSKSALVRDRLAPRLAKLGVGRWVDYLRLIQNREGAEALLAIDLLTTNETYFFREPTHFDLLRAQALKSAAQKQEFRVWSAACSSGEEPYSIAMVLADCFGLQSTAWSVLATDISIRMLKKARKGHYGLLRNDNIPPDYLRRYCLKGVGRQDGTFLLQPKLRERVQFERLPLNEPLPSLQLFDAIFLRNVMIYFPTDVKRDVIARLTLQLKPDGRLYVGHSESLHGLTTDLKALGSATYERAA